MLWYRIKEWFSEARERSRMISDFNKATKMAFTGAIVVTGITLWIMPFDRKPDNTTEQTQDTTTVDALVVAPGNVVAELTDTILTDTIHEEPFAWKPDTIPYLFGKPSARKIKEYKQLFEKIHREESKWWGTNIDNLPVERWYIINDLYSLRCNRELEKHIKNTGLILWRLNQYAPMQLSPGETAMDRYNKLQTQIDSVLNYDADAGDNAGWNIVLFKTYWMMSAKRY